MRVDSVQCVDEGRVTTGPYSLPDGSANTLVFRALGFHSKGDEVCNAWHGEQSSVIAAACRWGDRCVLRLLAALTPPIWGAEPLDLAAETLSARNSTLADPHFYCCWHCRVITCTPMLLLPCPLLAVLTLQAPAAAAYQAAQLPQG